MIMIWGCWEYGAVKNTPRTLTACQPKSAVLSLPSPVLAIPRTDSRASNNFNHKYFDRSSNLLKFHWTGVWSVHIKF